MKLSASALLLLSVALSLGAAIGLRSSLMSQAASAGILGEHELQAID